MRILHIIPQLPYFGNNSIVGGSANALFNLAVEQAKSHEVTILGYMPGLAEKRLTSHGIKLIPVAVAADPGTARFGLASIRQTVSWVAKHKQEVDLIHGHSGFLDYVLSSALAKTISGKPAIHSLYCPIPQEFGRWNKAAYKRLLKWSANRLTGLTAFSQNVQRSLNSYGIKRRHIHVTCPPVDLERFHPGPSSTALRLKLGLSEDNFVVLFVGNTKPAKNLSSVLLALYEVRQSLAEVKLIITTELKHSDHDERNMLLSKQMSELGLESAVIQLGIVDNMPELMRASDVLVAPFVDTFGPSDYFVAALEAMACGKPVIVSPVGGMPEIIDNMVGILVDPLDPTQIARAIQDLAVHPEKRLDIGVNAARLAQAMFAPNKVARQFDDIYKTIVRSS